MASLKSSRSLVQTRSDEIFSNIVREIQADDDYPDVMLVCCNEEFVPIKKSLLCFYSPLFRVIMGSIHGTKSDMETVLMPGFRKPVVEKMIRILKMEWSEKDTWGPEVMEIMQEFNITIGVFFDKEKEKIEMEQKKDLSQNKTLVLAEARTLHRPQNKTPNGKGIIMKVTSKQQIDKRSNFVESPNMSTSHCQREVSGVSARRVPEAKCPVQNCLRIFTGTGAKIKEKLICHIGLIHFFKEIQDLVDREYFIGSSNCKDCGKLLPSKSMKKKHLVFNHTKYVTKIINLVNKVIESSNRNQYNIARSALGVTTDLTFSSVPQVSEERKNSNLQSESTEEKRRTIITQEEDVNVDDLLQQSDGDEENEEKHNELLHLTSDRVITNDNGEYQKTRKGTEESEPRMESRDNQDADEDTEDIQRMLQEDMSSSDGDSDTDSDSLANRVDEDFEDEEFVEFGITESYFPSADYDQHKEESDDAETNNENALGSNINSRLMDMSDYENDGDDELDNRQVHGSEVSKVGREALMETWDDEEERLTQQQLLEMQDFSSSEDEDDISDHEA